MSKVIHWEKQQNSGPPNLSELPLPPLLPQEKYTGVSTPKTKSGVLRQSPLDPESHLVSPRKPVNLAGINH